MESDRGSSKSPSVDQSEQMCVSCGCPIRDRYVMKVTPDLHWHITCLACSECGKQLNEKITCFVKGGKTYCKEDYFRSKGIVCRKCNQPFKESDYVMRVDSLIYHSQCFTCSICQLCLRAGDQYYLDEQRNLFCLKDYEKKATDKNEYATPVVNDSNNIISNNNNNNGIASPAADSEEGDDDDDPDDDDELIFTEPKQQQPPSQHPHQHWNCSSNSVESFCCSESSFVASQGDSCKTLPHGRWPRDQSYQIVDSLQHQRHHISTGCLSNDTENNNNNKLSPLASATTTTMTANICQISSSISSPHCNSDYDNFLSPTTNDYNNFNRNNNNNSNYYKSFPQNQNMPTYYKHHQHSNPTNHRSFYSDNNNNHNNNNRTHTKSKSDSNIKSKTSLKSDPQPHKTTRIRTVLNEKQLHMLKTCYAANPRPDALMKDQLVEMTGLNSRVIRVWFQNKRCKDKKRSIQLKQVRQCNQDKMKNMGMITIASPTIQSDHSPNIGTSSLDSDKFMGPPSMTHSSSDWSDYTSYGMGRSGGRTYHSNNPSNLVDEPIYRSDGLNCNSGVGGQYQVPDQSQLIPRHQTPPIQQLLNSFGSNRVGPSERKNPYTDFSASKTKLLGNPIGRNDDIAHGNSHHDSHMSQEQGSSNNNNNGYSFDYDGRDMTGDS